MPGHCSFARCSLAALTATVLLIGAAFAQAAASFRADIDDTVTRVLRVAEAASPHGRARLPTDLPTDLPDPVRRYFEFVFQGQPPRPLRAVRMIEQGTFRRPGAETWAPMAVEQYVSPADPAFVFTGTTPLIPGVLPGVTARAVDAYVDGGMEMIVKVLSVFTVVEERGGVLDRTSLMRFFIEAPLFPTALLPGPHLRWEPIDAVRARAVVLAEGEPIGAYRATFAPDGSLVELWSETAGDAATADRFHGAREVGRRADYRLVDGVMVPHRFSLARRFGDRVEPFWTGTVTTIDFDVFARF